MRALHPNPLDDVDPLTTYLADRRVPPPGRPWVMVNMIASVDGATAIEGLSGALGGPADKAVFAAIRGSCDWIVVGSATAAAERYRTPTIGTATAAARRDHGHEGPPRLAIVTASGRVDPSIPALATPDPDGRRALVVTGTRADTAALADLDAEVVVVDEPTPEPDAVLDVLHSRGARVVLAEGGPTWNGRLTAAGVIDEVCLTLSPTLAGGDSARIVAGATGAPPAALRLDRLLEEDGLLFARYLRA